MPNKELDLFEGQPNGYKALVRAPGIKNDENIAYLHLIRDGLYAKGDPPEPSPNARQKLEAANGLVTESSAPASRQAALSASVDN